MTFEVSGNWATVAAHQCNPKIPNLNTLYKLTKPVQCEKNDTKSFFLAITYKQSNLNSSNKSMSIVVPSTLKLHKFIWNLDDRWTVFVTGIWTLNWPFLLFHLIVRRDPVKGQTQSWALLQIKNCTNSSLHVWNAVKNKKKKTRKRPSSWHQCASSHVYLSLYAFH